VYRDFFSVANENRKWVRVVIKTQTEKRFFQRRSFHEEFTLWIGSGGVNDYGTVTCIEFEVNCLSISIFDRSFYDQLSLLSIVTRKANQQYQGDKNSIHRYALNYW